MKLSHDEIRELLPAYALGAVGAEEAAAIRSHILGCEECMREADRFSETAGRLALGAPGEPVPAGFADRVLQAATSERPEVAPMPRPWWRKRLTAAVATLAALAIAGVTVAQVVETRRDQQRREEVSVALARDNGLELTGPGGVRARVVPHGVGSIFAVSGLEEAPAGRTYQLWLIDGDRPVSAGVFDVEDGVALLEVAQPVEDYDAAAVTIERMGGVDEPTTEPILTG